ncbi:transporter substrate-binding domain-containing protein [Thiolapillus brandeum]|nr:transporter substrate-binding domain-containing protein [Thiolapillus brandeum]
MGNAWAESQESASLKVVYRLDSAPLQFQNQQGDADGLFIDLWRRWSGKTGIPITFVGAFNKEAQQLVKNGQADILAGLFSNSRREAFLDFSQPVLNATYYAYIRDSLPGVHDLEDLKGHSIGVTAGSFHETYLRSRYPDLTLKLYPGYEELFAAMENADVDAIVTQPIYLQYRYSLPGHHAALRPLQPPLYEHAYRAAVKKGRQALLNRIDQGLSRISADERAQISARWIGVGWSGMASSIPELTEEEKDWLKQHPVIPVGGESDWPPFDFTDDTGTHQGVAAEYLHKIEKMLGVRFDVRTDLPWSEVLEKVREGELYFACTMVATPDRRQEFLFTQPYYTSPAAIVVNRSDSSIHRLEDLADKRVAIVRGYSVSEYLRRRFPGFTQIDVDSLLQGLQAVHAHKADAVLDNQDVLAWLLEENAIPDMRMIRVRELFRGNTNLRMGISKSYPMLAGILQKALNAIPAEEQRRLIGKWLPVARGDSSLERIYLSLEDQNWLSAHPNIRVGMDPVWPPVEYRDENGQYKGMASDYISLVASWMGIHLDMQKELARTDILKQVKAGEIDLLPAVVKSEERARFLNFTRPYLSFPVVIFTRRNAPFLTGLPDLQGKKVSVEEGYIMEEILRDRYPGIRLVTSKNSLSALKQLTVGSVDAYVGNLATASSLLQQYGLGNIKVAAPTPFNLDLRMGVRKDWPELVTILDKLLDSISDEQRAAIRKKWLQVDYAVKMDYQLLWRVVALSLMVLLVAFIWIYLIRSQKERLQKSEQQLTRILRALPIPVVVAEEDGTLVLANPQVAEEMESEGSRMLGRNMNEFYVDQKQRQNVIQQLIHEGRVDHYPVSLRTDRGNRIEGLMSAIPIELEGRNVHLGMFYNLTDRLRMEKELARAKADAERANAFKSRFLANMSHEIRTPMNAILGLAHLCNRTTLDARQKNYLDQLEGAARTLLNIINDILDLSRIEAGKLELEQSKFALWEVLEQVGTLNGVAATNKGLELLFRVQPGIPEHYLGDSLHLAQVLSNLVQNAVKFTEQGEIVVDIVSTSHTQSTATLVFSVRDSGIGIAEEDLPYLFEAFTQVDQSYRRRFSGTGLGLAISKTLVELMGGNIEVESQPGKGTCFRFFLNLDVIRDAQSEGQGADLLFGKKAFLIDGSSSARMILLEMLEGFGMSVEAFTTPEDVLRHLGRQAQEWPDVMMLGEVELTDDQQDQLKAMMDQGLPLLMLQRVGEEVELSSGVAGYVHKPVIPWLLKMKLLSVLGGKPVEIREGSVREIGAKRFRGEILLVEDNTVNQLVAREILEQFGLFVQVASGGREALNKLRDKRFDLVFMDIQMPDMDGYEVVGKIRSEPGLQDLPIVAMTAHALVGDREKSLQAGMNDHLSKPIEPAELQRVLEKWLPQEEQSSISAIDELDSVTFQLQYVDVQWGLERIGGNQRLFRKLLRQFLDDHEDTVRELEGKLLENDCESARRLVHTIHGVAATIGARKLERAADALEHSLMREDEEGLRFVVEEFCRNFSWVVADLHKYLDGNMPGAVGTRISRGIVSNEAVFKEISELVNAGSPEALARLDRINSASLSEAQASLMAVLQQELKDYEFTRAKKILEELMETTGETNG